MKTFEFTVKHAGGKFTVKINGSTQMQATLSLLAAERVPASAITKCREVEPEPEPDKNQTALAI